MNGKPQLRHAETYERRAAPREAGRRPERRVDLASRKRVAQMSPEEMKRTLLTHELTGIGNRRAYQEAEKLPVQAAVDADSLKWFNDTMGHEAGDRVLRAIASALDAATPEAYHIAGDEFLVQGHTEEEVHRAILRARRLLRRIAIEVELDDGTVIRKTGLEISYGIGCSRSDSELALARAKQAREASGVRAARGEPPRRGLVRIPGRRNTAPMQRAQPGRSHAWTRRWPRV